MRRFATTLAVALIVAACGGSTAATPHSSLPTGTIDTTAIQTAVAGLKSHDSWQFNVTTFEAGTPNFSRTGTGTQRSKPSSAVQLTITQSGQPNKNYTRIADDVWYDTGTGAYTKTSASDNAVISQFQPYYLDGLVSASQGSGYQYVPVGADTISGVAATHYRLADSFVQSIVKDMTGITPSDWAADVWIATTGGTLMRLAWGPQSVDKAQQPDGFNYVVTSLDCACPVDPPA